MAAGAPQWSSSTPGLARGLRRALRATVAVVLGLLATVGAVAAPLATLPGAVFAALAGGAVRALHRCAGAGLPTLPHPAVAAVSAAVLWAAVIGTAVTGQGSLGIVGGLSALAAAIGWYGGSCPEPQIRHAPPDPAPDDGSLRDLLRVVPIDVLFDEWRGTAEPAAPGDEESGTRTRMRCLLLTELRRRDPVGTERWLTEAPEAPPDGYVQDAQDRAA